MAPNHGDQCLQHPVEVDHRVGHLGTEMAVQDGCQQHAHGLVGDWKQVAINWLINKNKYSKQTLQIK